MPAAADQVEAERESVDQAALRLMLSYVEAECLRMGATDAARYAALAAAVMPEAAVRAAAPARPASSRRPAASPRPRGTRLH